MKKQHEVIEKAQQFINKYATLAEDYYTLPIVLWCMATHMWPEFDCFPYLVITAFIKRAGKTRLMELVGLLSANSETFSPDSPSSMFFAMTEGTKPTMLIDEAEKLNQENHPAREFLNKGYKKGQVITRRSGNEVIRYECFGPKVMVLIGDVYDTLRDRCIPVVMRRRTPVESANAPKFRMADANSEGENLREQIHAAIEEHQAEVMEAYNSSEGLSFLNDRDEEIWQVLFSLAKVFCPERITELTQSSVDISMEKTGEKRNSFNMAAVQAEREADDADARIFLVRDMLALLGHRDYLESSTLPDELKSIPTGQWRKYKGKGLSSTDIGNLLTQVGLHSKSIRVVKGAGSKAKGSKAGVFVRGYAKKDLLAAATLIGLR